MTNIQTSRDYSGIVINQNTSSNNPNHFVDLTDGEWVYQTLVLPNGYVRGQGEDSITPDISGIGFNVSVDQGKKEVAGFQWVLDFYLFGFGWVNLTSGTAFHAPREGEKVWMHEYIDPQVIPTGIEDNRMRIGIRSPQNPDPVVENDVHYDPIEKSIFIQSVKYRNVILYPGIEYPLEVDGFPGVVTYDGSVAKFSHISGIKKLWASVPNPLSSTSSMLTRDDGTPILVSGSQSSALFRLLALTVDSGTDILGNRYRSALSTLPPSNVLAGGGTSSSYWMSRPNPSRFAVETMHFDMRDNYGNEVTLDGFTIDPITPGMWANIYYSSEGDPEGTPDEWDYKLWKKVNASWKVDKRETILFPEPVVAKYIKVEFSHLQARHYSPGRFSRPVTYRKHPKWVLDYFIVRLDDYISRMNKATANSVVVSYNAYDLAFNYYLDDLGSSPDDPAAIDPSFNNDALEFISDRGDQSDIVDSNMLNLIYSATRPYRTGPLKNSSDTLLARVLRANELRLPQDNPVEIPSSQGVVDRALESFSGQPVAYENDYPVMYFFIQSRHKYRTVSAKFQYDKAYFAGVREIAFLRNDFSKSRDSKTYIEVGADTVNTRRNDFDHGAFAKSGSTIGDIGLDYFGEN